MEYAIYNHDHDMKFNYRWAKINKTKYTLYKETKSPAFVIPPERISLTVYDNYKCNVCGNTENRVISDGIVDHIEFCEKNNII
jgi:hypothetical protein